MVWTRVQWSQTYAYKIQSVVYLHFGEQIWNQQKRKVMKKIKKCIILTPIVYLLLSFDQTVQFKVLNNLTSRIK